MNLPNPSKPRGPLTGPQRSHLSKSQRRISASNEGDRTYIRVKNPNINDGC